MRWFFSTLIVATLASPLAAQDEDETEEPNAKKLLFDFSFDHDPRELYPEFVAPKGLRLIGPVSVAAYHVFPARIPGPYLAPPLRIWTNGWGTSLWRDPVTGWPEM